MFLTILLSSKWKIFHPKPTQPSEFDYKVLNIMSRVVRHLQNNSMKCKLTTKINTFAFIKIQEYNPPCRLSNFTCLKNRYKTYIEFASTSALQAKGRSKIPHARQVPNQTHIQSEEYVSKRKVSLYKLYPHSVNR